MLSPRLAAIVDALPLRPGMRVLEIGCGPGAAARAVAARIGMGHVLGIDRSPAAIAQAVAASADLIASGRLAFCHASIEAFEPEAHLPPFDLVFAVRVGALDGRHPDAGRLALANIARLVANKGRVFVDGGDPLREIHLPSPPGRATSRTRPASQ